MSNKGRNILIATSIFGALVATGIILFVSRKKRRDLEKQIGLGNTDVLDQTKETESSVVFPLQKGAGYDNTAENNAVKMVQRYLNIKIAENSYIGYTLLEEDGKFGAMTESALRRITGTSSVSYSLYKSMQTALIPKYLNPSTGTQPNTATFDLTNYMGI